MFMRIAVQEANGRYSVLSSVFDSEAKALATMRGYALEDIHRDGEPRVYALVNCNEAGRI